MHVEHIVPLAAGGSSEENNLWLACPLCNGHKGIQTHAIDPASGEEVRLFNPRWQVWREHFAWSADGILILGITACGRATTQQHLPGERAATLGVSWMASAFRRTCVIAPQLKA